MKRYLYLALVLIITAFLSSQFVGISIVSANGANETAPPCYQQHKIVGEDGCFSAFHEVAIDLSELNNRFVVLEHNTTSFRCGDDTLAVEPDNVFIYPTANEDGHYFEVIQKNYFGLKGGIEGLFKKKTIEPDVVFCENSSTHFEPSNNEELEKNKVRILIPLDSEIKDFWSNGVEEQPVDSNFRELDHSISSYIETSYPWVTKRIQAFYKPLGLHCEGEKCDIVIYKYKDIRTMNDGSLQENTFTPPKFSGLTSLLENSQRRTWWSNILCSFQSFIGIACTDNV